MVDITKDRDRSQASGFACKRDFCLSCILTANVDMGIRTWGSEHGEIRFRDLDIRFVSVAGFMECDDRAELEARVRTLAGLYVPPKVGGVFPKFRTSCESMGVYHNSWQFRPVVTD